MFKFLKEKLSSWIKKSKKEIEGKIEEVPKAEKEIKKEVEKPKQKERGGKRIKSGEEIKSEREVAEKVIYDIKKEGLEIKTPEEQFEEGTAEEEKLSIFQRIKRKFTYKLDQNEFEDIFQELETLLLENNVALEVAEKIKAGLQRQLVGKEMGRKEIENEIKASLKKALEDIIIEPDDILETIKQLNPDEKPFKIVFFGINGAGKTTTIAKFANLLKKNKITCVLAASDTFRAASIEQLQIHADRLGIKMIKQDYGADPAAVAFDAIKYAQNHKIDVVMIDTAGRMHTKENLLREMEKICRVAKPDLKVFVAEAIAGNDATEQARAFNEAAGIDGTILAKADVDERGGAVISISYATKKPILYLGTGQRYDDIELFNKEKFIKQLGL